jgi:hypothetical protein
MFHASAQEEKELARPYDFNKPQLFKELPERINVKLHELDGVFEQELGKPVTLPFSPGFTFHGTVVSKAEDPSANVKSIVIKSANKSGASLALSRFINEDNTISYRGRIMSFKHGDAYEIVLEKGAYYLLKKGLYDLYEE